MRQETPLRLPVCRFHAFQDARRICQEWNVAIVSQSKSTGSHLKEMSLPSSVVHIEETVPGPCEKEKQ